MTGHGARVDLVVVTPDQIDGLLVGAGADQFAARHGEVMAVGRVDAPRAGCPDHDAIGPRRHLAFDRASQHGGERPDDLHRHLRSRPGRVTDDHTNVLEPGIAVEPERFPIGHADGRPARTETPQHDTGGEPCPAR